MSVKVRPYRGGGWEVDVGVFLPDGTRRRERKKVPATSKTAAARWGEQRERELLVIAVNVIDIFGNDTMTLVPLTAG